MKLEVVIPIRGSDTELLQRCLESVYNADREGVRIHLVWEVPLHTATKSDLEDTIEITGKAVDYGFQSTDFSYPIWNKPVALNYALKRSNADWFGMLDGDYLIPTYFFQKIMDNFEDGYFIQCRGYDLGYDNDVSNFLLKDTSQSRVSLEEKAIFDCKPRPKADFGGFQCFPTEIGKKIRGYDERFKLYGGMHHEFRNRLLNYGLKEKRLHGDPIILHQWHEKWLGKYDGIAEPEIKRERNKHVEIIKELANGDRVMANEDIEWGEAVYED